MLICEFDQVPAKDATSEIPIVMLFVADPVGVGLATSLAHPGGNLTGRRLPYFESSCHRRSAWWLWSILQTKTISCYFRGTHNQRPPRWAFSSTLSKCA